MFVTYTQVILAKGLVVVSASAKKKKQMMEALEVFTIHFTNVFTNFFYSCKIENYTVV